MLAGFKEFIARGNAVDLAVGVVIGAAFTSVVNAIVDSLLNPLIAGVVGKPDFTEFLQFRLGDAVVQPGAVITALINFLLVAGAIYFFVVMPLNKLAARRKVEDAEPEAPAEDVRVLTEIRDLIAAQQRGGNGGNGGSTVTVTQPR